MLLNDKVGSFYILSCFRFLTGQGMRKVMRGVVETLVGT